tara:strand:+ start:421 stop:675 length:255 start_codon:yes stop_codon:yes gene_type:complete
MKLSLLPKNKFARVAFNVAFIAIWEEFAGLITEIIWETLDELGLFSQDSLPILVLEILFLFIPILSVTYWIWWGKNSIIKKFLK